MPDPTPALKEGQQYRVFYEERNDAGAIVLRQIIGWVSIEPDGGLWVRRREKPAVFLRSFHKIEEYDGSVGGA